MKISSKKNRFFTGLFILFAAGALLSAAEVIQEKEVTTASQSEKDSNRKKDQAKNPEGVVLHTEITVTATRTEKTVFDVPKPISVVSQKKIAELALNNISEILPELPGTDMVGVGANQSRPVIRGLRGQRILLLSDGVRMSNSRRTQSFGEIPSLVDVSWIDRVEVVRGPASVLYGSEAIGGVINLLSLTPDYNQSRTNISGSLGYRFGSADDQHKGFANISGNMGHFGFMVNGSYRKAGDYLAPAGSFGSITLDQNTPVIDTGVEDNNLNLFLGFRISERNDISIRYENYRARDAGFGYVDPSAYSPGDPTIQMLYPEQKLHKFTLRYENRALDFMLADGISFTSYYQENVRNFDTNISIPYFPGAGMNIRSSNHTDVSTFGARLEMTKVLFQSHVLTYGFDYFQDDSENTDTNSTEIFGFGPPMTSTDNTPNIPNAFFRSAGAFFQDDILLFPRASLILGLRYQSIHAQTNTTLGMEEPLVDSTDSTVVGAANFIYGITDNFKMILSLGRGFRSANLPERFFQGVVPDGRGYQVNNTELKPETSFNLDFGIRYRLKSLYIESTYFRNMVYDGIQIAGTGEMFGHLAEYKNVNIDKLRLQGVEVLGQLNLDFGLSFTANFSHISSKNLTNPELMNADTYGSRLNLNARYDFPTDLFWMEYHVRINGDRKDVDLDSNPIGSVIPGFTVHSVRAGVTLFKQSQFPQHLGIVVGNLTNTLYSEFSNASFFRPAPRRHVTFTWRIRF